MQNFWQKHKIIIHTKRICFSNFTVWNSGTTDFSIAENLTPFDTASEIEFVSQSSFKTSYTIFLLQSCWTLECSRSAKTVYKAKQSLKTNTFQWKLSHRIWRRFACADLVMENATLGLPLDRWATFNPVMAIKNDIGKSPVTAIELRRHTW